MLAALAISTVAVAESRVTGPVACAGFADLGAFSMPRFAQRIVEIASVIALIAFVTGPQPGLSQVSGGFAPSGIGSLSSDAPETDSISQQHFEHQLDGPSGIQPSDAAAAEARRQGFTSDQSVQLEEAVNRPLDLLYGGILRSPNDNNAGGTNNP